jgi:hypothetical protein
MLARRRHRFSPEFWVPPLAAGIVIAGAVVIQFRDVRYLWLPVVVCLSAVPVALASSWEWRRRSGGRARLAALLCLGLSAAVSLAWCWNVAFGEHGTIDSLLSQRRSGDRELRLQSAALLRPAADQGAEELAAGGVPFSGVAVASSSPGWTLAAGVRWVPLPQVLLSARAWRELSEAQRRARLDIFLGAVRSSRADYLLLLLQDCVDEPALGSLCWSPDLLPRGVGLLAELPGGPHRPPVARLLRVTPPEQDDGERE